MLPAEAPAITPVTTFKLGHAIWGYFWITTLAVSILLKLLETGALFPQFLQADAEAVPYAASCLLLYFTLAIYLSYCTAAEHS